MASRTPTISSLDLALLTGLSFPSRLLSPLHFEPVDTLVATGAFL